MYFKPLRTISRYCESGLKVCAKLYPNHWMEELKGSFAFGQEAQTQWASSDHKPCVKLILVVQLNTLFTTPKDEASCGPNSNGV